MPQKKGPLSQDMIDQMFTPSTAQGDAVDVDAAVQRAFASQSPAVQNLQQSIAYGSTQDPDSYAKLLSLQKQTGVAPQMAKDYQPQLQAGADRQSIDYPQFVQDAPRTAGWASNPDNAAVSGVDELHRMASIEMQQRAAADSPLQALINERDRVTSDSTGNQFLDTYKAWAGKFNTTFADAFIPILNAAGVAVQAPLETGKALLNKAAYGDQFDLGQDLSDIWQANRRWKVQDLTDKIRNYVSMNVPEGPQAKLQSGSGVTFDNPDYHWYGRPLLNTSAEVPAMLAAFALGGRGAAAGEAAAGAGAGEAGAAGVLGAEGAGLESKVIPALLGTDAAQNTYAAARERGADERTAVTAALSAGITNFLYMGAMPAGVPAEDVAGVLKNWGIRSTAFGTAMGLSDNAIAKSYDPDRGLFEGLPHSIATMAAFEGVGALTNMVGLAEQSKLRARSPESFREAMQAILGDAAHVRIPIEAFDVYFNSKSLDPVEMAQKLGVQNIVEGKVASDVYEIPTANFIADLDTEHQKALLPDIIDAAKGMSVRQYTQRVQQLRDFVANGGIEQMQGDIEAVDAETEASPEYREVKEQLRERFAGAGETPEKTEALATINANVYTNLARAAGMTPREMLEIRSPVVKVGDAPGVSEPAVPEGMTRLYHGSESGNREGAAWFSSDREYARNYRKNAELQYVDYPTAKLRERDETFENGGTFIGELDLSETGARKPISTSQSDVGTPGVDLSPKKPEVATPEEIAGNGGQIPFGKTGSMKRTDLTLEPETMQYKLGTDAKTGTSDKFDDVSKWDPSLAGVIHYWHDPETGKNIVVNGHHRHEMASRFGIDDLNVMPIDARNAREARGMGALLNIADDKGTEFDAAKYFRESGETPETLESKGISLKKGTARDGLALSRLSADIFDDAVQGRISKSRGVALGEQTADHAVQEETLTKVREKEADGAHVSDAWVKEYARQIELAGGAHSVEDTESLFGGTTTESLIDQRTDVTSFVREKLADDKRLFGGLTDEKKAAKLGEVKGQRINAKKNAQIAEQADNARLAFEIQSRQPGEVNDVINDAAKRLKDGKPKKQVLSDAYDRIGAALREADSGGPRAHGGDVSAVTRGDSGVQSEVDPTKPIGDGTTLFQGEGENPRGWFRALPDGTFEIGKTRIGDLATLIHEPAHAYLEMIGNLVKREGASETLKSDYQKILSFLGAKDGEPLTTEQHELWARANEQYFREGNPPSKSLAGVFQRFSVWMQSIYKQASELGVELTPEIREVMDRMYAGEEGVNRAVEDAGPHTFQSVGEAGWTEEQAKHYADLNNMSVEEAKTDILAKLNEAALRDRTEAWRSEVANVRAAVTDSLDASREYKAIRSLRKGELEDGNPLTLNKETLVTQFGEERVAALQKLHHGLYRNEGGADPEVVAELHGYLTAEGMMRALEKTPRRSEAIEKATRDFMTAKHGDIRYDGSLKDAADVAFANDKRAEALHMEMEALSRRNHPAFELRKAENELREQTKQTAKDMESLANTLIKKTDQQQQQIEAREQKIAELKDKIEKLKESVKKQHQEEAAGKRFANATAPLETYRDAAHQMIESKPIAELQPARYLDASRMYARKALQAFGAGDWWGAKQAKNKELMNHFLFREAIKAQAGLDSAKKLYDRIYAPDKTLAKSRAMDLVNAARAILSAVGIGKGKAMPQDPMVYVEGIRRYNPDLFDELEPIITMAFQKGMNGYQKMTVAEARELRQAVETLWHRSRRDQQVLIDGKLRDREDVVSELNQRTNDIGPRTRQPGAATAVTSGDRIINSLYQAKAAFRRVEYWANSMDGVEGVGPFTRYIIRPVLNALTDYRIQREEPMKQLLGIISQFDVAKGKIEAPELGYTFGAGNGGLGKFELLGAILHTGNDSNMRKLLLGRVWGDNAGGMGDLDSSRWEAFMARMYQAGTITQHDMDLVQQIWDLTEALKPTLQKTFHDLYGYYFKEVEAHTLDTPFGTYRGGYVPAKVDPFMVRDAQLHAKMEDLESDFKNSLPSTGLGFTITRKENYTQPLSLDLRVISKHIDDTLRFAVVQPAIRDVLSIMRDRTFSSLLGEIDPVAMESMLVPWLNRSARQISSEPGMLPSVDRFWNTVRSRVGTSTMFFNLANSLVHIPNLSFSALQVKPGYLAASLAHYMGSPRQMTDDIINRSDFMKSRLDLQARKMQQSINNILTNKGAIGKSQDWFQEHGYFIQHAVWNVSDIITWRGAFNEALDAIDTTLPPDKAEAEAIQRADAIVRMTQGSENPEDLARYQVGTPFFKSMIQFTSWFNSMGNLKVTEVTKTLRDMGLKAGAGRLAYIYLFGMAIPYALSEGMVGAARGEFDQDEDMLPQILSWFFGSQLKGMASEVPFGNLAMNATKAVYQQATGNGKSFDDRLTSNPAVSALQASSVGTAQALSHLFSHDKELTGKNVRDLMTMLSLLTRVPVSAIGRPAGYLVDVHRGAVKPTGPVDAVRGFLTGSPSEASRVH